MSYGIVGTALPISVPRDLRKFLKNLSEHSYFDVDYRDEYDCSSQGCEEEGICRCGTIVDTEINRIDSDRIIEDFLEAYEEDGKIMQYCLYRLLSRVGFDNRHLWDVDVLPGYYGEEIEGVSFNDDELLSNTQKLVDTLSELSDDEKVRFVLKNEYGTLLPRHESCSFEIINIPVNAIHSRKDTYESVDSKTVEAYKDLLLKNKTLRELPLCLVEQSGSAYRLQDGRHRFTALNILRERLEIEGNAPEMMTSEDENVRSKAKMFYKNGKVNVLVARHD